MCAVSLFRSVDDLPPDGRDLFESAGANCFFSSAAWFRTFAQHALDEDDSVRIYYVNSSSGNDPAAALATVTKAADRGLLKPRKLCSLSSYYTSLFSLALKNDADVQKSARELATAIAKESPRWDEVELRPFDVGSPVFAALVAAFQDSGFVVQTYFCFGNWYLEVEGRSFSEYLNGLPSVLKSTLHRKKKKLQKSGRSSTQIVTGGAQLEDAIEAYSKVYLASWKQPEPYPNFVPELMRICAKLGTLRLGLVHLDGEPAAAQFWIVQNRTALIYKLAYDERFTDFSVGTILTAAMMEHALDVDKVSVVDYLSGDDGYKRDWMSHRRERWGILAMNPRTLRGASAIGWHVGGRAVKRAINLVFKAVRKSQGLSSRGLKLNTEIEA